MITTVIKTELKCVEYFTRSSPLVDTLFNYVFVRLTRKQTMKLLHALANLHYVGLLYFNARFCVLGALSYVMLQFHYIFIFL